MPDTTESSPTFWTRVKAFAGTVWTLIVQFFAALAGHQGFDSQRWARICLGLALVVVALAIAFIARGNMASLASLPADPRDPAFDGILLSRLVKTRLWMMQGVDALSLVKTWFIFIVLDRTSLGKRFWHWSELDAPNVAAVKTFVAGLVFIALFLGFCITGAKVMP